MKTPWKKHIDKRYISGEDLKYGIENQKGLAPEMVVTFDSFEEVMAYNQSQAKEVKQTGVWLKSVETGHKLYKPLILNNINGSFLQKEIGGGSIYLEDFDKNIKFVLYAKPDRRFNFVARLKKHYEEATTDPKPLIAKMEACKSLGELGQVWTSFTVLEKKIPAVVKRKEELKEKLNK